jgi:hypothetical protein
LLWNTGLALGMEMLMECPGVRIHNDVSAMKSLLSDVGLAPSVFAEVSPCTVLSPNLMKLFVVLMQQVQS